jgi:hypothetical protein
MKPAVVRGTAWLAVPLSLATFLMLLEPAYGQRRIGGGFRPSGGFSGRRTPTTIPRPPNQGNFTGTRPGMAIGGPRPPVVVPIIVPRTTQTIWQCPKCKREVGRGAIPPANVTCCGIQYVNGRPVGAANIPALANPPVANPNQFDAPQVTPPGGDSATASDSSSSSKGSSVAIAVGVVVLGLLLLGGVGLVVFFVARGSAAPPKRRRPRRESGSDDRPRHDKVRDDDRPRRNSAYDDDRPRRRPPLPETVDEDDRPRRVVRRRPHEEY